MTFILTVLIINGYLQSWRTRTKTRNEDQMKSEAMKPNIHVFKVDGMTCAHCKASVEKGLKELGNVADAVADPGNNMVKVSAVTVEDDEIRSAIETLGYSFGGRK
jgi:hypothetical protein